MVAKRYISVVLCGALLVGCVSTSDSPEIDKNKAVKSYLNLAKGYLQQGYSEKATRPVRRALELDARSPEAHGVQALLFQAQGEDALAEKSFRKALTLDPSASDIHNNFGVFLLNLGRLDDAYYQFSKAAGDVNYLSRSRAYENMGLVSVRKGDTNKAREHFERALKLNSYLTRARFELAFIFDRLGEYQTAWDHYKVFARSARQSERSLALGIRLASAVGDRDASASYSLQLENLYPSRDGVSQ